MNISQDEANVIYARFLCARYGVNAPSIAQDRIQKLAADEDRFGIAVWTSVFENVRSLLQNKASAEEGFYDPHAYRNEIAAKRSLV